MTARPGLRALAFTLSLVPVALVVPMTAAGSAARTTQAYLVVGVPGSTVDVLVDGREVETGVAAKTVVGPVRLQPGAHTATFRSGSWEVDADFDAGRPSLDLVVHRPADAAADPVVTVFTNEMAPIAANKARLTVAHTAVVPPADVRAAGNVLFSNIANGEFVTAEVPPATYSVDIVATGGNTPVFGPVDVPVQEGALTRVFAIGNPSEGTMDAVVQVLQLRTLAVGTPRSVGAGSVGLVAPPR